MNQSSKDKRKRPATLNIPWGAVFGVLGITFGVVVWALDTLEPTPAEDPNWVPLAEVEELRNELTLVTRQSQQLDKRNKQSQQRLTQVQQSHNQIQAQLRQAIPLTQIPAELRAENATLTAAKINRLWQDQQLAGRTTVNALLLVLGQILETGIINTTLPAQDTATRDLYRAVQTVLQGVGTYQGAINGEQKGTYEALIQFQKQRKLKVDGKMGMKTFGAIAEQFQTSLIAERG